MSERRNLNLSRVRTFHPKGVKCPTCGRHAIRLIIPKEASDGDWTQAKCNRCAGDGEATEQGPGPEDGRPAVRRVSDRPPLGRVPGPILDRVRRIFDGATAE